MTPGKLIRAPFLYQTQDPIIIAPIDDYLIFGPKHGLECPKMSISKLVEAQPDAVLTFAGNIRQYPEQYQKLPRIVNLSASTTRSMHTSKVSVTSLESALRCNANAVAVHINICSSQVDAMLEMAGDVINRATEYEMPVVGIIYPRGEKDGKDYNFEDLKNDSPSEYADLIAHCVAIGVSLGVDIIKTYYTYNAEYFKKVVVAAGSTPIVIAGGPRVDDREILEVAKSAVAAGAAGISFGRNLFGHSDQKYLVQELRKLKRHIL